MKKTQVKKKELTQRQKDALANHKKKGTHTPQHMKIMKEEMLKGNPRKASTLLWFHKRDNLLSLLT